MSQGMMTEREWRRRALRTRRRSSACWGAQCWRPRPGLRQDRRVRLSMLACALACAVALPSAVPRRRTKTPYASLPAQAAPQETARPRTVSAVSYDRPPELLYTSEIYERETLLRGKLLLLDETHPLPGDAPSPNTISIANGGHGMVPVVDLSVKSGKETIRALERLFAGLRGRGAGCFFVSRATMTPLEQTELRLSRFRTLAAGASLEEAARQAVAETDEPGAGELRQEFAVELSSNPAEILARPLEESSYGRVLLQTAWRYGFIIVSSGGSSARLRYVGEAHSTAMTYLDMTLPEYLEWLHEKKTLWVNRGDGSRYLILCQPMTGSYVEFWRPEGAEADASLDNLGYAVAAYTVRD